jgi:hypothetical protein
MEGLKSIYVCIRSLLGDLSGLKLKKLQLKMIMQLQMKSQLQLKMKKRKKKRKKKKKKQKIKKVKSIYLQKQSHRKTVKQVVLKPKMTNSKQQVIGLNQFLVTQILKMNLITTRTMKKIACVMDTKSKNSLNSLTNANTSP